MGFHFASLVRVDAMNSALQRAEKHIRQAGSAIYHVQVETGHLNDLDRRRVEIGKANRSGKRFDLTDDAQQEICNMFCLDVFASGQDQEKWFHNPREEAERTNSIQRNGPRVFGLSVPIMFKHDTQRIVINISDMCIYIYIYIDIYHIMLY